RWRNARMTTVILDKADDGEWYATLSVGWISSDTARPLLTPPRRTAGWWMIASEKNDQVQVRGRRRQNRAIDLSYSVCR
ncbi:MAG: hypothetical protein ACI9YT_000868, partial [Halobacteriales archaeon]